MAREPCAAGRRVCVVDCASESQAYLLRYCSQLRVCEKYADEHVKKGVECVPGIPEFARIHIYRRQALPDDNSYGL